MEIKAKFEPFQPYLPKCSMCGCFVDKGNAALEHLCKDCYGDEIRMEIYNLIGEYARTMKVSMDAIYHETGLQVALNRAIRRGKE